MLYKTKNKHKQNKMTIYCKKDLSSPELRIIDLYIWKVWQLTIQPHINVTSI